MESCVERRGAVKLYSRSVPEMGDVVRDTITQLESMDRDDAFFIVDLSNVYKRLVDWRRLLPRVEPFYAIKCNNDPEVARFLADAGVGFDCASEREIKQVLDLGVQPSRIVFANPCKRTSHVQFAARSNVDLMTFDDLNELLKIRNYHPHARLLLRIKSSREHRAKHSFNAKFGCDPEVAMSLLKQARNLGLTVIGISFHVGSLPEVVSCFAATIAEAGRVFKLGEDLGFNMSLLDIGGGFPGVDTDNMTFDKVAAVVNEALDEHFPVSKNVRIIAEPGRYMVTSGFTLAVSVIAKRTAGRSHSATGTTDNGPPHDCGHSSHVQMTGATDRERENRPESRMYYISDGIFGSFNNVFTDHAVITPNLVLDPEEIGESCSSNRKYPSILWGPTCDGMDCVLKDCLLPELDVGQWLYFHDMGAYTITVSSDFNGVPRPLRFYVCDVLSWNSVYNTGRDETFISAPPTVDLDYVGHLARSNSVLADDKKHNRYSTQHNYRLTLSKGE